MKTAENSKLLEFAKTYEKKGKSDKRKLFDYARSFNYDLGFLANMKAQAIATKAIRTIQSNRKVGKDYLVCKMRTHVASVACAYPEINTFDVLLKIEYFTNKALRLEGYTYEVSVWEFQCDC